MNVAVVKYNAGNIFSVVHALKRMGVEPLLTDSPDELRSADKVIFPGQGEASNAMRYLRERGLDEVIRSLTQPVLGICIGQQLMCSHSEEGDTDCLGVFDVPVLRLRPKDRTLKVPHMGWNSLEIVKDEGLRVKDEGLFKDFKGGEFVYFVHSFYVPVCEWTIATTEYAQPLSAALHRDNFYATQFHPEKSGSVGEKILQNFLKIR